MPIYYKDKKCRDCGVEMKQVHPAVVKCDACKKKAKAEKLRVLRETYKPKPAPTPEPEPTLADEPGEHEVQIYAMPRNPFLRLIEFEDGSHGTVRVRPDSPLRTGMRLTVAHPGNASPHILVGRYNRWGVRMA